MMSTIGMYTFWFLGFTGINRVLEGQLVTSADMTTVNSLTVFTSYNIAGFPVPVPNVNFLVGLARLGKWDYSFFGGSGEMLVFMMYSFTAALAMGFFLIMVGSVLSSFFARR